jgi:hypothetical protein
MVAAVFIAGFFTAAVAGAEKAPSSRAVKEVAEQEKPTGRIVGQIKLPERPKLKLPDSVKLEDGAKLPEVRLKSISVLGMSGTKDPFAEAELDGEGRFAFEGVPAGPVRLQPNFVSVDKSTETDAEVGRTFSLGQSFTLHTTVQAGQTTEVAFFGRGRPVTGKIVLPDGIKPNDASVRLTFVDPPSRAMYGRGERPRPTPLAVAFGIVKPDRELESEPLDADGGFRVEGVPEGTYRLHVTIRGENAGVRVWFTGYAAGQAEWVKNGMFNVPLMKDGTSETPWNLGAPRFERLPKPG